MAGTAASGFVTGWEPGAVRTRNAPGRDYRTADTAGRKVAGAAVNTVSDTFSPVAPNIGENGARHPFRCSAAVTPSPTPNGPGDAAGPPNRFPLIACVVGVFALAGVLLGQRPAADGGTTLPLLTLLAMSELGFIVCAIGAFLAARELKTNGLRAAAAASALLCATLGVALLATGLALWPG